MMGYKMPPVSSPPEYRRAQRSQQSMLSEEDIKRVSRKIVEVLQEGWCADIAQKMGRAELHIFKLAAIDAVLCSTAVTRRIRDLESTYAQDRLKRQITETHQALAIARRENMK